MGKIYFPCAKFGMLQILLYLCGEILKQSSMADKIKFDKRNYRRHDDANKKIIRKSLEELGAGRSIVIDKDGEIIAGNGVYEQAEKLGLKTRVIETDGSELVVVKRTDLATGDEKRRKLALADNAASDMSDWDTDLLREDWDADVLADWGVKLPDDLEYDKPEDVSDTGEMEYKIEVTCKNEAEQEQMYNKLIAEGYECRLLTL